MRRAGVKLGTWLEAWMLAKNPQGIIHAPTLTFTVQEVLEQFRSRIIRAKR